MIVYLPLLAVVFGCTKSSESPYIGSYYDTSGDIQNIKPGIREPFERIYTALREYEQKYGSFPESLHELVEVDLLDEIYQPNWGIKKWKYSVPYWALKSGGGFKLLAMRREDPTYDGLAFMYTKETGLTWDWDH
jgi:hypothetical protein